jgi:hypothetical protein
MDARCGVGQTWPDSGFDQNGSISGSVIDPEERRRRRLMLNRRVLGGFIVVAMVLAAALPAAAVDIPLKNWSAPATWTAPASSGSGRTALALSQGPAVPFIPVAPCRVMDTRGLGQTGAFGTPTIPANGTRTVPIPTHPTCTGIPSPVFAYSLNLTVTNTGSGAGGYLQVWPTGAAQPTSSNLNYPGVGATVANAAVVQAGTSGSINVFSANASADVIIDINGYYTWNASNSEFGSFAVTTSQNLGYAILGLNSQANGTGVWGQANNGTGAIGVKGQSTPGIGVLGASTSNVGTKGTSSTFNGVWAESTSQDGLFASGGRHGVYAISTGTTTPLFAVFGATTSTTIGTAGVFGQATGGAPTNWAQNLQGTAGVVGVTKGGYGVEGVSNPAGWAGHFITQDPSTGNVQSEVFLAPSSNYAGTFYGNVIIGSSTGGPGTLSVAGFITKAGGGFKIDDPLDPENKYLYHSFVESPDMMNIYNGIVELDALGEAIVALPAYFEALNKDFRYQLTSIGQSQPNLYVADEIQNLQFRIAGGKPHAKASWQVTGVRQDPVANANRYISEVAKEPEAKGYYLHTAAYKQPADKDLTRRMMEVQKAAEIEKARIQNQSQ